MPCSTSANGGWRRSSSFSLPATRVGGACGGVRERPHLFLRKPRPRRSRVGDAVRCDRGAARSAHQGDGPRSAGSAALRRVAHGRAPRGSRELDPHERTGHDSDRRPAAEHAHPRGIGAPDLHLHEDYIRTATSKGLAPWTVVTRHALRNALIPVVSAVGALVPRLLGGTVVTEAVFGWPGMGRLALEAAQGRDYPLVTGLTVVVAAIAVAATLIVDLAYTRIDPRVHLQ